MTAACALALCALGFAIPAAAGVDPAAMVPVHEGSYSARIVVSTVARAQADPASKLVGRLRARSDSTGGPMELLVLEAQDDAAGGRWLRVRLPSRPNDRSGWIDADHAVVSANRWRVVVHTRTRRVAVYRSGKRIKTFRSVVGKRSTPTPHGLFAIYERARQPNPRGFLGPWALHLTAHSNVLKNYGGGPGRVAIHGRAGKSLRDRLGTARSHGCIRVANHQIKWLARNLPPGTPVQITN